MKSNSSRKIPFLVFVLAQVLAGAILTLVWPYLKLSVSNDPGLWPVWTGIFCVAALAMAFFLLVGKKDYFLRLSGLDRLSFQNITLFLFSFLAAALTGVAAKDVVPYYLRNHALSAHGQNVLFALCVGLPFLIFDFNLLVGDRVMRLAGSNDFSRSKIKLTPFFKKVNRFWINHPGVVSLLISTISYIAFLAIFHIGYETNDDVFVAAIASGYLGGTASPFLVFSNVLLGFLLKLLYGLPTRLNWEILFFIALNFFSVWALIHQIFSRSKKPALKIMGALAILSCNAYFLIKINFTSIAAFGSLAGFALLFSAPLSHAPVRKGTLIAGSALLLAASLIRIESVLLMFLVVIPALIVYHRAFQIRALALSLLAVGVLIAGCYGFNKLYVRSSPAWQAYTVYTQTRSSLQDTPRLANLASTYPEVGWSKNDYQLFEHWFLADPQVYSLQNLQTLVQQTPPGRATLTGTLYLFSDNLSRPLSLAYLFLMVAVWLAMLIYKVPAKKGLLPSLLIMITCFGIIVYLITVMKIPNRVLFSTLSASVIFGFFLLLASGPERTEDLPQVSWLGVNSLLLSLAMAAGLVVGQVVISSHTNVKRQTAYHQILTNLESLQQQGTIRPDALIISPAYGVPLEWANPLVLDFPPIQYLSMGWLTFSPPYEAVLQKFGVASLPDGFYRNDNVYLMATSARLDGICQFILEHEGVEVDVSVLYEMPPVPGEPAYDGVELYKLELKR